jgi:hypothetical protein
VVQPEVVREEEELLVVAESAGVHQEVEEDLEIADEAEVEVVRSPAAEVDREEDLVREEVVSEEEDENMYSTCGICHGVCVVDDVRQKCCYCGLRATLLHRHRRIGGICNNAFFQFCV